MIPAVPILGPAAAHTVLQPFYRAVLPMVLQISFSPNPMPEAFARAVPLEVMLRPAQLRATAEDLSATLPSLAALWRQYPHIDVPVAVLAGEEDRVAYPHAHAVALSRLLPDASLSLVPGTGHMLHHVRPDVVMKAIEEVHERATARRGRHEAGR